MRISLRDCRLLLSLGVTIAILAQEAKPPAFDVASVKLAAEETIRFQGRRIQTTPDSLTTHALTLRACIMFAYGMPPQVIGPDWMDQIRLDIAAETAKPADDKQLYRMLRTLLEERMGLKTHVEKREMGVYALTVAKGGPKFQESKTGRPEVERMGGNVMIVERATLGELVAELSAKGFDRPVIDATGLKGRYDVRFDMAAARTAGQMNPNDPAGAMMSAVEDQMGLRIVPRKADVDVLVVDHVERKPAEN